MSERDPESPVDPALQWQTRAYYLSVYDGWDMDRIAREFSKSPLEVAKAIKEKATEANDRNAQLQRDMKERFEKSL